MTTAEQRRGAKGTSEREPAARGPGRPTDAGDRRSDILAAARTEFAAHGFDRASVRGIARAAKVDASLVHHYFGSKQDVFIAAVRFPLDVRRTVVEIFAGDRLTIGERFVRFFLSVYEDAARREPVIALLRSAMGHESVATMMREFVTAALMGPGAAQLDLPEDEARLRVQLAVSQLIGVAMLRYILKLQPLASASTEQLVQRLGPVVQLHFDLPVPRA